MSGVFGAVTPVQVPDFGATLARAQGIQSNRLAMLAQQRQMQNEDAQQQFFAQNGAGFASADPATRMNLLAQLAAQPGGARMALPMLAQERERSQFQDIMRGAFQPGGGASAPAQGGYVDRLVSAESGGDPNARNPRSTATGAAQFIDGTWLQFARANPQLFAGMNEQQILAARSDPNLSRQAADWYRRENMTTLASQGLPANDGTAALAHRFGPGDAARLLRTDPAAPIASVVSEQVMRANPDLAGRTVGQVVGQYAQRFGGGAPGAGPAQPGRGQQAGAPDARAQWVAGAERAVAALTQAGRMEEAARLSQIIAGMRRGESEPLERVRGPDGRERLVPRSQAAGMVSEPAPRETPGPFGNERTGRALQQIEELAPAVSDGTATPEQLRRYGSAVTDYQQETVRPDGSRVTPSLPPYAPGRDWVAQRYPGFAFGSAPPAVGPNATPAGTPPMGDATPAAPALPQSGGAASLPGAGGGVTREGNAMEAGTRRELEQSLVAGQAAITRLTAIERAYDPQMQTYGNRWSNMWAALRERSGAQLSAQERQRLTQYTQGRAQALENLNNTIKETTGAAMTEGEAARITATMPNPGTGLFDGDSPTEFQAKLQRAINATRNAIVRQNYALSRGLNPTETGIELDQIPRLYQRRGREIEAELRQASPDADPAQMHQQVRVRLRQEFGI